MKVKDIDKLYDLEEGWNGYDARPVPKEAIDRAKAFLELITKKGEPQVFPTPDNSVMLEYYKSEDNYISIEISDKDISMTWMSPVLKEPIEI